ncbi:MAG: gliding motility-associated C-terminal domain-containing protein [Saprospiraceae bacterium]|jgi:gliding motility-associated-like protein|nr:gliding motility-associated C-terminal domain-containing protein [Saprospiraceae bacterium]
MKKRLSFFAFSGIVCAMLWANMLGAQVCNTTANAGADAIVCAPGATVSLSGTVTGTYLTSAWTPNTGVVNPASLNTNATVNATTTYQLSVRSLSPTNLIVNGDFAVFDTVSFDSDYIYGTGGGVGLLSNEGQYALAINSGTTHNQFADCDDHSPGNNYMMVVNASGTASAVWCQTVTVEANTEYQFGAWATSVVSQNPAKLQFSANGTLLGNIFNASPTTCNWTQFTATWNSATATSVEICVRNVNFTPAGNDFALDDITLQKICVATDELTVTVADLNASWNSPTALCSSGSPLVLNTLLTTDATLGGTWTIDGTTATTFNPATLSVGAHSVRYAVTQGPCSDESVQTINIAAAPNAGTAEPLLAFCSIDAANVQLGTLLTGADPGGVWSETSATPSTGGAFNAATGAFNAAGQSPGVYAFTYTVSGQTVCPDATVEVEVEINATPTADAGADATIDCTMNTASLGGPNTTPGMKYTWTALGGSTVADPENSTTNATQGDTYTLTVVDPNNGCSSTDEVVVTSNIASISASATVTPVTCDKPDRGTITVGPVSGGTMPYTYAINGGAFQAETLFGGLTPGDYSIAVMDAFGCDTTLQFTLDAPSQISVAISADGNQQVPSVTLGDSIRIRAVVSLPADQVDTLIWTPALPGCFGCDNAFVSPDTATTYTVTAFDLNGCSASAQITIQVIKRYRIYAPNAFSPNADGINDTFTLFIGAGVRQVNYLSVHDRWGALVYKTTTLPINTADAGWNGEINGRKAPSGLYVYVAEIEMEDGERIIQSGEVSLLR